eukprot:1157381-Pelagomonas_calceolata.AAC.3
MSNAPQQDSKRIRSRSRGSTETGIEREMFNAPQQESKRMESRSRGSTETGVEEGKEMFNAPQQDSKRMGLRSRGSVHGKFGLETKKREGSGYCLLQKRPHFQRNATHEGECKLDVILLCDAFAWVEEQSMHFLRHARVAVKASGSSVQLSMSQDSPPPVPPPNLHCLGPLTHQHSMESRCIGPEFRPTVELFSLYQPGDLIVANSPLARR